MVYCFDLLNLWSVPIGPIQSPGGHAWRRRWEGVYGISHSSRRGTGLGLSMVYELAKKMDAGLAVESVVDQGSTFTLVIPLQQTQAVPLGEEPKSDLQTIKA
jgi:hypothetical protein